MRKCFAIVASLLMTVTALAQVEIDSKRGRITLTALDDNAVRVRIGEFDTATPELIYVETGLKSELSKVENKKTLRVKLKGMTVVFDKKLQTLKFLNKDGVSVLEECDVLKNPQNNGTSASATFLSPTDEHLFGTGQFQDGNLDVKGLSRRLTQVNTQIALPMVLSNKGYALLWNNYGLTDFNPASQSVALQPVEGEGETQIVDVTSTEGNKKERRNINAFAAEVEVKADGEYCLLLDVGQKMARKHKLSVDGNVVVDINNIWLPPTTSVKVHLKKGKHKFVAEGEKHDKPVVFWRKIDDTTTFSSPIADGVDYTVFVGSADESIASYRRVTGPCPEMPEWALGYIHCRERYVSSQDILENVAEFRRRGIPLDVIVQDWQWWGKHGWNAMRFDEDHYPDPKLLVDSLHKQDVRLMLSVWSKIDKNSELGKEMERKGHYIPETDWIDFFDEEASQAYWQNFSERLLKPYGIDAWWQDATEPENDDLHGRMVGRGTLEGDRYRNVYPLMVNKTVYGGLRKDDPDRLPMILTRSAFPGIQRYGAATWSGDVGHDFGTLRRQIVGGLGQMAAGLPWWTYDAGGFFRPHDQYTSKAYHEIFIRWLQTATFLPLMRTHGYMSQTEPWRYGEEVERLSTKYIKLRYQLLPYIIKEAKLVSDEGYTLMRPLVMDFPSDDEALKQDTEYMFGHAILVCPVTKPLSELNDSKLKVYLPKGTDWVDFWTKKKYTGGQYIETAASLDIIPLFVRAGAEIPMAKASVQHSGEIKKAGTEIVRF